MSVTTFAQLQSRLQYVPLVSLSRALLVLFWLTRRLEFVCAKKKKEGCEKEGVGRRWEGPEQVFCGQCELLESRAVMGIAERNSLAETGSFFSIFLSFFFYRPDRHLYRDCAGFLFFWGGRRREGLGGSGWFGNEQVEDVGARGRNNSREKCINHKLHVR